MLTLRFFVERETRVVAVNIPEFLGLQVAGVHTARCAALCLVDFVDVKIDAVTLANFPSSDRLDLSFDPPESVDMKNDDHRRFVEWVTKTKGIPAVPPQKVYRTIADAAKRLPDIEAFIFGADP